MSPAATAAQRSTAARPLPSSGSPRPMLRLVPPRRFRPPRLPFAALVVGLLGVGLAGLLTLNTLAAQDAFRLHDLQRKATALDDEQQQLSTSLARLQSPSSLSARALRLGMQPGGAEVFLRLPDGRVLGAVSAAALAPTPAPLTPAQLAAAAKARADAAHKRAAAHKPGVARKPSPTSSSTAPKPAAHGTTAATTTTRSGAATTRTSAPATGTTTGRAGVTPPPAH